MIGMIGMMTNKNEDVGFAVRAYPLAKQSVSQWLLVNNL